MRTAWPRRRRLAVMGFAGALLLAAAGAPAASPADSGKVRKLPEGVKPLAPEMQKKLGALQRAAERYRGLALKKSVPMGLRGEASLKKKLVETFQHEMPRQVLDPVQRTLKLFGFIPQKMDLARYYPKLLTSQVAGYYDPDQKYLVLVDRKGGMLGPKAAQTFGPGVAAMLEDSAMVHELDHAIQDQHFDLQHFGHDKPLSDAAVAKLALIEGDATHVMYSYLLKAPMERVPMVNVSLDSFLQNPKDMLAMMPDMPGSKELLAAPAYIRENLLFSYIQGLSFCVQVRKAGGQKLLDYAFRTDPPKSSEQILHPKKWIGTRDDPIRIELPDLAKRLPGYAKIAEGNWGEFNTRLMLLEKLGPDARQKSVAAAAGWGGDAFALYKDKEGGEVLTWITEWDTPKDAREFHALAGAAFREDWKIALSGGGQATRVTLTRGELSGEQRKAISNALDTAKAVRPANRRIDFTALGITEKDKPTPLSLAEMQRFLQDPAMKKLMAMSLGVKEGGELDLAKLMNNPQVKKMINKMGRKLLGEGAAGLDLEKMMQDPAIQKMMQQMLAGQKPAPKGHVKEGRYRNEQLGLSIRKPKAPGWTLDGHPQKPALGPTPIVELSNPAKTAKVVLVRQALPMAIPVEMLPASLEVGFKMQMKDFTKIKGGFLKTNGQKGYEIEFTGSARGSPKMHILQRVYIRGSHMLLLVGTASDEAWAREAKAIREAVDSFAFTEKKAPEKKPAPLDGKILQE